MFLGLESKLGASEHPLGYDFILVIPLLALKYIIFVLLLADITEAAGLDP